VAGYQLAAGDEGMTMRAPPRWLEHILMRILPIRDRDTVSGDLLEEYREEKVSRLGPLRANIWYLRQVLSILCARSFGGAPMKVHLLWMSMFTAACGVWLGFMEHVLKHPGYAARTAIAAYIVVEGLATFLLIVLNGGAIYRVFVAMIAISVAILGGAAINRTLQAPHFEGFVLVIGCALIMQGLLTLAVVLSGRTSNTLNGI
jgi:hypothetical protein